MAKTDKAKAEAQLRKAFQTIRDEAGPELFRQLFDEMALSLAPMIRRDLAEGRITEDHPGYQALLDVERRRAAAVDRKDA